MFQRAARLREDDKKGRDVEWADKGNPRERNQEYSTGRGEIRKEGDKKARPWSLGEKRGKKSGAQQKQQEKKWREDEQKLN